MENIVLHPDIRIRRFEVCDQRFKFIRPVRKQIDLVSVRHDRARALQQHAHHVIVALFDPVRNRFSLIDVLRLIAGDGRLVLLLLCLEQVAFAQILTEEKVEQKAKNRDKIQHEKPGPGRARIAVLRKHKHGSKKNVAPEDHLNDIRPYKLRTDLSHTLPPFGRSLHSRWLVYSNRFLYFNKKRLTKSLNYNKLSCDADRSFVRAIFSISKEVFSWTVSEYFLPYSPLSR